MKAIYLNNQVVWFDEELLVENPQEVFDADYWRKRDAIVGSASGRGTTWFVRSNKLECALRHYHRGGLFGKLVRDSYLFLGWERTRSYQEFKLLERLISVGVHVPRPIAARALKQGFSYTADLLSEKIPNARDLVSILAEQPLPAEMYRKIGQEIKKMHDAQVNHTDLNIHNILIDDREKVWIIDFDKCSQRSGDSWKQGNLDRLKRSFEKEQVKKSIKWSDLNWNSMLSGYYE